MKKKLFFVVLLSFVLFTTSRKILAQDSIKVLIISPRVGAVIDQKEAEYFRLFRSITVFDSAVFYQSRDSNYYAYLIYHSPNGIMKDTTLSFSKVTLELIAKKIDHFEEYLKGHYEFNEPPKIVAVDEDKQKMMKLNLKNNNIKYNFRINPRKLYPFEKNDFDYYRESYPKLGFGAGISSYNPDFSNLNAAFISLENKYRGQGYSVRESKNDYHLKEAVWAALEVDLSKYFSFLGELSIVNEDIELRAVSLSLLYYYNITGYGFVRPFAGCGIGKYNFKLTKNYGVQLNYGTLESADIAGGGIGFNVTIGMELRATRIFSFNFYAKYLAVKKVESFTTDGQRYSVNLNSFLLGGNFIISFDF